MTICLLLLPGSLILKSLVDEEITTECQRPWESGTRRGEDPITFVSISSVAVAARIVDPEGAVDKNIASECHLPKKSGGMVRGDGGRGGGGGAGAGARRQCWPFFLSFLSLSFFLFFPFFFPAFLHRRRG